MKTLYWAWGPGGRGHATRAAAIARWLDNPLVIRGSTEGNDILDKYGIEYKVFKGKAEAWKFISKQQFDNFVFDENITQYNLPERTNTNIFYVWRYGRKISSHIPTIYIEGNHPDAYFPVIHLDPDEILNRSEAREELGIPDSEYIRMGIGEMTPQDAVDIIVTDTPLRVMRAADEIVAYIGYNTYAEVSYHGIPVEWKIRPNRPDQVIRFNNLKIQPKFSLRAAADIAFHIEGD